MFKSEKVASFFQLPENQGSDAHCWTGRYQVTETEGRGAREGGEDGAGRREVGVAENVVRCGPYGLCICTLPPKHLPNHHYNNIITLFIIITPVPCKKQQQTNDLQAQYSIAAHQSRNSLKIKIK